MSAASPYDTLVQELYIAYFGRPVDYFGLQNFDVALANAQAPTDATNLAWEYDLNPPVHSLIYGFDTSSESVALYGSGSTQDFINAIYQDLFNRPAALTGLVFWSEAIDSGRLSKGLAALAILAGAQQNTSAQGLIDQQTIANKVAVAENFTLALGGSSNDIVAYYGAAAAADTRSMLSTVDSTTIPANFNIQTTLQNIVGNAPFGHYAMTSAPEGVVGGIGNNIFTAVLDNAAGLSAGGQVQTLVTGDSIVGGGISNALNLTDFGIGGVMTIPSGVTIDGVAIWNISSLEAVSGDFSNWSGLSLLNVNDSTGNDAIVAGDGMIVNVSDKAGNVSVLGGSKVTVATDSAHAVTLNSSAAGFTATVGNSSNTITDTTANAVIAIAVGTGSNNVTLGSDVQGTISFAAHTAADAVALGPSQSNIGVMLVIGGLNNSGSDSITFSGDANTLVGFTQVTSAEVTASGGDPTLLDAWLRAADGAYGSGVGGAAHTVTWFVFQGNTYLLESVAGQTKDSGAIPLDVTLVELTGTGYSFTHASGAGGTLHLLG